MPALPTEPRPVVAAFDVDGTLTTRDCVTPFLREVAGARLPLAFLRHPVRLGRALLGRDVDAVKALACGTLSGLDAGDLDRRGGAFAERIEASWMREDTVARLQAHGRRGHRVVLVSASLEPYLVPLGARLGVDAVLCTRLEIGADGAATGGLSGLNCRGPEKERRLRSWLEREGLTGAELWAYGDSAGDAELLAMADHPQHVAGIEVPPELPDH